MTATATPAPFAPPTTPSAPAPTGRGPDLRRKFTLMEFGANHNKSWQIEAWDLGGGRVRLRTTWGRVGATPQCKEKIGSEAELRRLIAEKEHKGYQEIDLHVPQAAPAMPAPATPPLPRQVTELLDLIFSEAGQRISSYLAVGVDALSQAQIRRGRALLDQATGAYRAWQRSQARADFAALVETIKAYYNVIPTQLPRNLSDAAVMQEVVLAFCRDFAEQETRLNQLEAALATDTARAQAGVSQVSQPGPYALLGAQISLLPEKGQEYAAVVDFLGRTTRHGYGIRVRDIFAVEVPSERRAFAANTFGSHLVLRLTHGTNNANLRHILHEHGAGSGLRVPNTMTNGWMFGPGIYFANIASKSANYCRSRADNPRTMFLADVAVGDMFVAREAMSAASVAPAGYHAVWGKAGVTGSWGGKLLFDEFIVYRACQQTIRYLVTWDPR